MRLKLTLTLALLFCCMGHAVAQQQRFGATMNLTMSRFIDPPRTLRQALREAEEAIEQKQYTEAVVTLGDLLQRDADPEEGGLNNQDFFLDIKETLPQRASESFLWHCHDLIGSLPDAGRKTYALRYGPLAKQLLDSATATRDWEKLRAVRRKYFHTESGYQASLLLAQRELYQGHPLTASLILDRVVESRAAVNRLGREVLVLHAVACRLSGRSLPGGVWDIDESITFGTESVESIDDWRAWIDKHYSFTRSDKLAEATDYPVLGGSQARNETSQGQLPLSSERYAVETAPTSLELQIIRSKGEELAASGKLVPPSWTPIVVGDQLIMRTTKRLSGVEHRTGKRVWEFPWYETRETTESEPTLSPLGQTQPNPATRMMQRVWNDVPYGQITSDGKRIFLLKDLSPAQSIQINPLMGFRGTRGTQGGSNTLVALELATQGKTLWRVGKDPTVVSELNEAFFLGAPLPVDGYLYAMIEMAGDISLVCLDPVTGGLEWQQQLVANEGWGVQFNPLRRVAGATPTYHEGVLICPTGAGATVAVDLADRTLRWGVTYPRKADYSNNINRGRVPDESTENLLQRWHHPAAIANRQSVLVTPVETDQLFCFELVDGKRRFSKPRSGAFYAAGIRGDRFFVVDGLQVKSYFLEKGKIDWATDPEHLVAGQQIVGRGVFSKDSYLVPASGNELIQFSLEDGSLIERRKVNFPLGNLIAVNGEIVSQSATHVAVALGVETLGPKVEQILKESPDDVDGLTKKALLLIESGDRAEALTVLQRARELDPENDDVLFHSVDAMLG
ncbi:MAG: PQQ-binding-like beta-propeller repeat protein, partial [Planctomycetota bacterium]